ncbi:MAG: ATP-binding protein [Eubacterium sp.]|nr:ATP-binding protein [Eubacterium sp.]
MGKKLPIGIQSFEKIRTDNFLYVDKTEYVYDLVHNNIPYFLSRPRRFGKSLLLSTLKAYWEGKRELFEGLAIDELESGNSDSWQSYPVFYLDFNGQNYTDTTVESVIEGMLQGWEAIYGKTREGASYSDRFEELILAAENEYKQRAVVLVDEYDKALLETSYDSKLQDHIKSVLKGLFGVLKKADEHIQFVFITGVTKFHKVSIFSDLNQLKDISLSREYPGICGITESELVKYFGEQIDTLADNNDMQVSECMDALRSQYDGYHFSSLDVGVYNPFSLLNAFYDKEFGLYWFSTGSPSFLVDIIRRNHIDVSKFSTNSIYITENRLKDYSGDSNDIVPLLYQTGYLTIYEYDRKRARYTLGFPNEEVRYGFLDSMLPAYTPHVVAGNGLDVFTLEEHLENGDIEKVMNVFKGLFADIAYSNNDETFEHYFQTIIYIVFTLLGKFVQCERHTAEGRIDCIVQTRDFIYIFEFKRDDTAASALEQIKDRQYAAPFVADSRKLFEVGVSFDSEARQLVDWRVHSL